MRGIVVAALVAGAAGCTLITLEADQFARVEVDPVIRQRLWIIATGEFIENEPVQDPSEVACAIATPRTCFVSEYVRASVFNGAPSVLTLYPRFCPPPIQRLGTNGWEWLAPFIACAAIGIGPVEIEPGDTELVTLYILGAPWYDWRTAGDELRLELDLSDRHGDLPLAMRTSEPFRLSVQ